MREDRFRVPAGSREQKRAMSSEGSTRLDAGRKGQYLQDNCRVFSWKFFQTQQQFTSKPRSPCPPTVTPKIESTLNTEFTIGSPGVEINMLC
ncbi:hypothetical protein TNCV_1910961 [Trichonephila clavipes]|nr:hypothetical protein TNCV_1910961 [Trichonephila clavipes]